MLMGHRGPPVGGPVTAWWRWQVGGWWHVRPLNTLQRCVPLRSRQDGQLQLYFCGCVGVGGCGGGSGGRGGLSDCIFGVVLMCV